MALLNGGTTAVKPFLAESGDMDISGSVMSYQNAVNAAAKAAYVFFHMIPANGQLLDYSGHLTVVAQTNRVIGPINAWWKYILNNDATARSWFVGSSCMLCNRASEFDFGQKGL